jgi:hypothetical protein
VLRRAEYVSLNDLCSDEQRTAYDSISRSNFQAIRFSGLGIYTTSLMLSHEVCLLMLSNRKSDTSQPTFAPFPVSFQLSLPSVHLTGTLAISQYAHLAAEHAGQASRLMLMLSWLHLHWSCDMLGDGAFNASINPATHTLPDVHVFLFGLGKLVSVQP